MTQLKSLDIQALARGTAFLGSGGGGPVKQSGEIIEHQISQNRSIEVMQTWELEDKDLILILGYIGSPLVFLERLYSLSPLLNLVKSAEDHYCQPVKAIFPLAIGGTIGLVPFFVTPQRNLPVLDGDLMGRTFPHMNKVSTNVFKVPLPVAWVSDAFGNIHQIKPKSYEDLEEKARALCLEFGLAAFFALAFRKKEIEKALIQGTVSKALRLGQCATIEELCTESQGRVLIKGFIKDCRYETVEGLLNGTITVEAPDGSKVEILLRNEFVRVKNNQETLAQCPDIISLLNVETLEVIPAENIFMGQWVHVVAARGPEIWYTPEGRALIGDIQ